MTEYKVRYQTSDRPVDRAHTDLQAAARDMHDCQHEAFRNGDTQGIWLVALEDGIERPFTQEELDVLVDII